MSPKGQLITWELGGGGGRGYLVMNKLYLFHYCFSGAHITNTSVYIGVFRIKPIRVRNFNQLKYLIRIKVVSRMTFLFD